uniref:Uncharacterized protein n=1 Tax=Anguilla anguilla TaxID=7936 RepID=A0A0E9QM54_ANGAN
MAAASARLLGQVGRHALLTRGCNTGYFALAPRISRQGGVRAYGTGGTEFRSKLFNGALIRGGGRTLGCAFLLGVVSACTRRSSSPFTVISQSKSQTQPKQHLS